MIPEIPKTPANDFDQVLNGARPINVGTPEKRLDDRANALAWRDVYERDIADPEARSPYRIILAWRITRYLAERTGKLRSEQPLTELPDDTWEALRTGTAPDAEGDARTWPLAMVLNRGDGIPLHPGTTPTERWRIALEKIATHLELEQGSEQIPLLGYYGLQELDDRWPSQDDILKFERELLDGIMAQIEHKGQSRVASYVAGLTGMTMSDSRKFARVAQWQMRAETLVEPEIARSIMIQQLEQVVHRAQQDNEKVVELRAQKQLADIRGLTKSHGSADIDEILEFMKNVEKEDREDDTQTDVPPLEDIDNEFLSPEPNK